MAIYRNRQHPDEVVVCDDDKCELFVTDFHSDDEMECCDDSCECCEE